MSADEAQAVCLAQGLKPLDHHLLDAAYIGDDAAGRQPADVFAQKSIGGFRGKREDQQFGVLQHVRTARTVHRAALQRVHQGVRIAVDAGYDAVGVFPQRIGERAADEPETGDGDVGNRKHRRPLLIQ